MNNLIFIKQISGFFFVKFNFKNLQNLGKKCWRFASLSFVILERSWFEIQITHRSKYSFTHHLYYHLNGVFNYKTNNTNKLTDNVFFKIMIYFLFFYYLKMDGGISYLHKNKLGDNLVDADLALKDMSHYFFYDGIYSGRFPFDTYDFAVALTK